MVRYCLRFNDLASSDRRTVHLQAAVDSRIIRRFFGRKSAEKITVVEYFAYSSLVLIIDIVLRSALRQRDTWQLDGDVLL